MTTPPLPQLMAITVIADRYPDGTYGATVNVGPDLSWSMPGPRARRYVIAMFEAATAADHDAALYATLACRGIPDEITASVITDVRAARPRDRWTAPLTVTTILTAAEPHRPVLTVRPDGAAEPWQWTPDEARQHARQVLEAVTAAEEDNRLAAVLLDSGGLPPAVVAAVIDHMQGHWPTDADE